MLKRVLEAREERAEKRQLMANRKTTSISLSFNIPGFPKSDEQISAAFSLVKKDLINYLIASRIKFSGEDGLSYIDHAGDFFIMPVINNDFTAREIKNMMEDFEGDHILSRLIDVDIFDADAKPVSSGKAKKCMMCSEPAIVCMREGNHSMQEIRGFISTMLVDYLESERQEKISQILTTQATKALLYEVSTTAKPGLVDRYSQGSHTDMDFFSFLSSSAALSYYWKDIAEIAYTWDGKEREKTLVKIRRVGIKMENAMLCSTDFANTQKGAIFIMGFTVFACAYLLNKSSILKDNDIRSIISYLNKDIVKNELKPTTGLSSHGEKVYFKYGAKLGGGIRQEMEDGLPIIFEHSLPYLNSLGEIDNSEETWNEVLKNVLLEIISVNDDTNILYRSNAEILTETKELATICKNSKGELKLTKYNELIAFCAKHNISPGGSADLLAVTFFIHSLQIENI